VGINKVGVVVFLHVGVVVVSFMIAAVLHAALHALPRAKTVQQMRPFAALVHRLEPMLPILALFILGFGAWLIHLEDLKWGDGWILTGLVALIVVEGLAGALLAPHSKKLVAAIEAAGEGVASTELRRQTLDPFIWYVAHIATVSFLGVVFVMLDKPTGGGAVLIVAISAIVGVALARVQLNAAAKQIG
jgi:hypothetical protein